MPKFLAISRGSLFSCSARKLRSISISVLTEILPLLNNNNNTSLERLRRHTQWTYRQRALDQSQLSSRFSCCSFARLEVPVAYNVPPNKAIGDGLIDPTLSLIRRSIWY